MPACAAWYRQGVSEPLRPRPDGQLVQGERAATAPVTSPASSLRRDLTNAPNLISISRILVACAAPVLFASGYRKLGVIVGFVAGLTDYLDGWLARRLGKVTPLGALLDRLADLALESAGFVLGAWGGFIHPAFFMLYLMREFVVLSARAYSAEYGVAIPSSFIGKLKTNALLISLCGIFVSLLGVIPDPQTSATLMKLSKWGLAFGIVCSYVSAWQYLRGFASAYNGVTDEPAPTALPAPAKVDAAP